VIGARMTQTLPAGDLGDFNVQAWAKGDYVSAYSSRTVLPAEAALIANYRGSLNGPVLELGCGAGRLTRVLVSLGKVLAVDISERMVEACRRNVPAAEVELGDLRDLSAHPDGAFRAIVASNNLIDVLGDDERKRVLAEWARLLSPDGVLIFSSHNQANVPFLDTSLRYYTRGALRSPGAFARAVYYTARLPVRLRNRRAARAFERDGGAYAIINDPVHDHRLAHYYIRRDAQERQLADARLKLVDCLDIEGRPVGPGEEAERSSELHYAARPLP
jgi:SAM-dependent methyltransferase